MIIHCWMCTGISWAYGRSSSADSYVSRHKKYDVSAADISRRRPLDSDRGQLQQSASVVKGNDASAPRREQHVQQMTEANARSPGRLIDVFTIK